MIRLNKVSKSFSNGLKVLDDLSLHICKEEFVYLIGASGVGKSTLLKLIFMADFPTEGEIYVDKFLLKDIRPHQIPYLRRSMGIIFQDYKLLPKRTVYENVAFALSVMHVAGPRLKRQVRHSLELVGLAHKQTAYPHELSGGEQQKMCIARAIVNNPPILLCDEPTGNLDPDTSWDIVQLLTKINRERKTTILMSTHDTEIVDGLPKRVIELQQGKIHRDQNLGGYSR